MTVPDDLNIDPLGLLDFVFDMKVKPYRMVIRTFPEGKYMLILVKEYNPYIAIASLTVKDKMDAIWIRDNVAAADNPEDEFKRWAEYHANS